MSLSKIGKVSNAVKLLNTAATSGDIATGISSLSNSLRAAGNALHLCLLRNLSCCFYKALS